jgi:small-conductance mechanosensitive channel
MFASIRDLFDDRKAQAVTLDFSTLQQLWAEHLRTPIYWPIAVVLSALFFLLVQLLYHFGFKLLRNLAEKTRTELDDLLLRHSRFPAQLLIFLVTTHVYFRITAQDPLHLETFVFVCELLLLAFLGIEVFQTVVIHYWLGERQNIQIPTVVRHLLVVILYLVAFLSIIGMVTGINVLPLLATSTVLTVVLGLALQDTLGNLFSGLALHTEKPFSIGDWILVDNIEGQVVYVGWRSTHLKTFSGDLVIFPNSTIAKARVQNFYAPTKLTSRSLEFPVTLSASPEAVERATKRACEEVERVLQDPPPKLWLVGVTPLFQRYVVKFWLDDFQVHDDTESNVLKRLWYALREEKIYLQEAHPSYDPQSSQVVATK